jgi:hypothetical protein
MTEAEWVTCTDAYPMLVFLGGKASQRKLRLFACALGRRLWGRLSNDAVRHAVEFAERVADGRASRAKLKPAWDAACASHRGTHGQRANWAAAHSASPDIRFWAGASACQAGMTGLRKAGVAAVLREVFGNLFRPVAFDPAWRTADVTALVTSAYEERLMPSGELDPHRLSVLADALEELGAAAEVVAHLRGPGPHLRGCWAVDLCLGKA